MKTELQPLVGGTIQAATLPMPSKPVNWFPKLASDEDHA
jgi:hypothetical protein